MTIRIADDLSNLHEFTAHKAARAGLREFVQRTGASGPRSTVRPSHALRDRVVKDLIEQAEAHALDKGINQADAVLRIVKLSRNADHLAVWQQDSVPPSEADATLEGEVMR